MSVAPSSLMTCMHNSACLMLGISPAIVYSSAAAVGRRRIRAMWQNHQTRVCKEPKRRFPSLHSVLRDCSCARSVSFFLARAFFFPRLDFEHVFRKRQEAMLPTFVELPTTYSMNGSSARATFAGPWAGLGLTQYGAPRLAELTSRGRRIVFGLLR